MDEHRRVALIVAVDSYEHHELNQLAAASADADALADVLGRPDLGGFEVRVVRNETAAVVLGEIEEFLGERRPSDLALLHFSGHGLKDAAGELHLAARNTSPNRLVSTAIDATRVNQLIRTSRAGSVVLFLDCCYGGAFERGMVARAAGTVEVQGTFDQKSLGSGRGRVVITASSAVQYAFEGRDLTEGGSIEPSVFTGAIVDGIRDGLADRDGDGYVGLAELYDYVYERVRSRTPHQTPSKWEYGLQGELLIARSPRRVVRAAQLPPELVEIMRHPYSAARLGAITELTRLVDGDDLGLATAAVTALGVMSEDDSRVVSAEAVAVLRSRAPALSVESFDLGVLTVGGPAVERRSQLTGPPLVEAAEVVCATPRLQARLDRRTLVIRVDPSEPGPLDTTVSVRSPLGVQLLYVRGRVVASPAQRHSTPTPQPPLQQRPQYPPTKSLQPPQGGYPPAGPTAQQPPAAFPTPPAQQERRPFSEPPAQSPPNVQPARPKTTTPGTGRRLRVQPQDRAGWMAPPATRTAFWLGLAVLGGVLTAVSTLLPVRTGSSYSLWQHGQWAITAVLQLVAAATTTLLVPSASRWLGVGAALWGVAVQWLTLVSEISDAGDEGHAISAGPWTLAIGSSVTLVAVVVLLVRRDRYIPRRPVRWKDRSSLWRQGAGSVALLGSLVLITALEASYLVLFVPLLLALFVMLWTGRSATPERTAKRGSAAF